MSGLKTMQDCHDAGLEKISSAEALDLCEQAHAKGFIAGLEAAKEKCKEVERVFLDGGHDAKTRKVRYAMADASAGAGRCSREIRTLINEHKEKPDDG